MVLGVGKLPLAGLGAGMNECVARLLQPAFHDIRRNLRMELQAIGTGAIAKRLVRKSGTLCEKLGPVWQVEAFLMPLVDMERRIQESVRRRGWLDLNITDFAQTLGVGSYGSS